MRVAYEGRSELETNSVNQERKRTKTDIKFWLQKTSELVQRIENSLNWGIELFVSLLTCFNQVILSFISM